MVEIIENKKREITEKLIMLSNRLGYHLEVLDWDIILHRKYPWYNRIFVTEARIYIYDSTIEIKDIKKSIYNNILNFAELIEKELGIKVKVYED